VLIIGSDTPVGQALERLLQERGREVVSLPRADCRWKSERQVKKALRRSRCPFVVDTRLQAAADGGVRIHDIDIDRTAWVARTCQNNDQVCFHLSCARVFSGQLERHYGEDDYPDAEDTLGELLAGAEAAVRDRCERHVILRTGPVFASSGINVLTHMLDQLAGGGTLQLGSRLRGCPVADVDAARVLSGLLDQFSTGVQAWGIYHYCSSDLTNCYEFAEVLLACASQFAEFSASAVELEREEPPRPVLARVLACDKIRDTFAIKQMPWRRYVADAVKAYFS
jgi:dTDP-4-dehydrorhamnose reductase